MEAQQPTQTINSNREEKEDEEFYEKIEAPKFVDFTLSDDPFCPDDRYWFCLRVDNLSFLPKIISLYNNYIFFEFYFVEKVHIFICCIVVIYIEFWGLFVLNLYL